MRELKYISPSGYMMYKRAPDKFFRVYLADTRMPITPATKAMGVGSCFDVIVKNKLLKELGIIDQDAQEYPKDAGPEAIAAGEHVFQVYQESGAYEDLLKDLRPCRVDPRFEDKIVGTVDIDGLGVPIGGLPDLYYYTPANQLVVLDWKVNGYYSKSTRSPNKGWVKLYSKKDKWIKKYGHSTSDYQVTDAGLVNTKYPLEEVYKDWAIQLSMYAWCLGGGQFTTRIEQIVGKPGKDKPELRVASHCNLVSEEFQQELRKDLHELWTRAHGNWFYDLSPAEAERKERLLNKMNELMNDDKQFTTVSFEDLCTK